jgi:hypothetical protein
MEYLTASGTKTFTINFAGNQLILKTRTGTGNHTAYITMMRSSATNLHYIGYVLEATSIFTTAGPTNLTFDPTISNDITVKVTAGAANDIKFWFAFAELLVQ